MAEATSIGEILAGVLMELRAADAEREAWEEQWILEARRRIEEMDKARKKRNG